MLTLGTLKDIWAAVILPAPARPDQALDNDSYNRAWLKAEGVDAAQVDHFFDRYEVKREHVKNIFKLNASNPVITATRWASRIGMAATFGLVASVPTLPFPNNISGCVGVLTIGLTTIALRKVYFSSRNSVTKIVNRQFAHMKMAADLPDGHDIFVRKMINLNPAKARQDKVFGQTIDLKAT